MADEGIRVTISPSAAGAGGLRLAESPSFASDRFTGGQQRFSAPGVGPRDQIAVEQKLLAVETKLASVTEQLGKKFERATGATASERATFESRIDRLSQSMKREAEPEGASGSKSAIDRERAAQARTGPAAMPGSAARSGALASGMTGAAGSLINAGGAAWSGDVSGTLGHLAEASMLRRGAGWAWGGAKGLLGYGAEGAEAGEAVAGGVAAEGAEAAGAGALGSVGLPALAIAGTAAAGYGAYRYLSGGSGGRAGGALGGLVRGGIDDALAVPQDLLTLAAARRYGSEEEPRQALAFRAAREFGESGAGMIAATTGSRWSSLGIDPATATQTVSTMREIGGSRYISNQQAYAGAKLGTYLGFSPEQTAQVGGAAGRLGVSPEEAIRVIAQGVERGNQQGRQFEVASASLDYLKQIATSAAVSGTGLTAISNLSAILAKSGIAAFQGAGGVSAISGIESAHRADDLFGVKSMGAAFAQYGEAEMLRGAHGDIAKAEEIRQGGFSGRYSKIYGAAIHREISMARGLGPLGTEALEEEWNMPVGAYIDPRTGRNVSVNSALDDLDSAIQSGDYLKASRIQSDLLASGAKNISPMESAAAGHALGRALTGESTARTYAAGERLEAAGLSLLRRNINDRSTSSALDYLSSTLGPTKPSALDSATAATSAIAGYGIGGVLGAGTLGSGAAAAGSVAGYGLGDVLSGRLGGAPAAAGAVAGYGLGDSISGAVILLAGILERILAAVERNGGAPSSAPAAPPMVHADSAVGPTSPTASTPRVSPARGSHR